MTLVMQLCILMGVNYISVNLIESLLAVWKCYWMQFWVLEPQWGQAILKRWSLDQRNVFFVGHARRLVPCAPLKKQIKNKIKLKSPQLPEGFQQSIFKGEVDGRGWLLQTSWCRKPLTIQVRSWCSCIPPTKQNVFLCSANFLICVWMEKCYTLEGQSLENGLFCIIQAVSNILNL